MKYHISMNGEVNKCTATVKCRLKGGHFESAEQAQDYRTNKVVDMHEDYKYKVNSEQKYNQEQAKERGFVINWEISEQFIKGKDSASLYFDNEMGTWDINRQIKHREIIDGLLEKYKDIPCDRKVLFSAGLPGAGKTTVLKQLEDFNINDYATVSADDIKEIMARKGMIPKVEGLSRIESSTLVHEESSHLANEFLKEIGEKGSNVIYDFTCHSKQSAQTRIDMLTKNDYETKDMQFIFVDIPLETAKERAIWRYTLGLNESLQNDINVKNGMPSDDEKSMGGRHLPESVIERNAPAGKGHNSRNAEIIIELSKNKNLNLPEPIIYDNSGSIPKKLVFEEFAKRE